MKRRFSEERIAQILREGVAAETRAEVWRTHGISAWADDRWRQRHEVCWPFTPSGLICWQSSHESTKS